MGMLMYAQDYDETYAPYFEFRDCKTTPPIGGWWCCCPNEGWVFVQQLVANYVSGASFNLFLCPDGVQALNGPSTANYGINPAIFTRPPRWILLGRRLSRVSAPAERAAIFDSGNWVMGYGQRQSTIHGENVYFYFPGTTEV